MKFRKVELVTIFVAQIFLFILFIVFGKYDKQYKDEKYPMFQDIHGMIFVGFGFLMTFLKRYGFSAVGFNFLLASFAIQWALLSQGFYNLTEDYKIEISLVSLYRADIAAAAVLISMGAVLGKTTPFQLMVMGIIEIAVYSANLYLQTEIFKVVDAGGSIIVHAFGAYFGLAVSYVLERGHDLSEQNPHEGSRYTSDLFAMIGTIFLWIFWPSFNAIELTSAEQQRAIINTYLSLAACCVVTFSISMWLDQNQKLDMVHIQNSTLAGGVAIGSCANLMVEPFGAVLIGMVSSLVSVYGYSKLTPWLKKTFKLHDTCGVHNLHGLPGVLAAAASAIMAAVASEELYGAHGLYGVYPALGKQSNAFEDGRSPGQQGGYQVLGILSTVLIAVGSGIVTGILLKPSRISVPANNKYGDELYWTLPEPEIIHQGSTIPAVSSLSEIKSNTSLSRNAVYTNKSFSSD